MISDSPVIKPSRWGMFEDVEPLDGYLDNVPPRQSSGKFGVLPDRSVDSKLDLTSYEAILQWKLRSDVYQRLTEVENGAVWKSVREYATHEFKFAVGKYPTDESLRDAWDALPHSSRLFMVQQVHRQFSWYHQPGVNSPRSSGTLIVDVLDSIPIRIPARMKRDADLEYEAAVRRELDATRFQDTHQLPIACDTICSYRVVCNAAAFIARYSSGGSNFPAVYGDRLATSGFRDMPPGTALFTHKLTYDEGTFGDAEQRQFESKLVGAVPQQFDPISDGRLSAPSRVFGKDGDLEYSYEIGIDTCPCKVEPEPRRK